MQNFDQTCTYQSERLHRIIAISGFGFNFGLKFNACRALLAVLINRVAKFHSFKISLRSLQYFAALFAAITAKFKLRFAPYGAAFCVLEKRKVDGERVGA